MERVSNNNGNFTAGPLTSTFQAEIDSNQTKNFKCNECSTYFSSKHCLIEHGYRHSGLRKYSCLFCQKTFRYASQLSLHKKIHRQNNTANWPKLTDLIMRQKIEVRLNEGGIEKIDLPQIKGPVYRKLPGFQSIFSS